MRISVPALPGMVSAASLKVLCRHARQDSSSEDGGERAKRRRRYWRATRQTPERPDPVVAAKNKANRERQRREKLNDWQDFNLKCCVSQVIPCTGDY